jgi:hypothetical protein
LSNLEEGVYTFSLKVTDAKGQSNEDQVNIFCQLYKIRLNSAFVQPLFSLCSAFVWFGYGY